MSELRKVKKKFVQRNKILVINLPQEMEEQIRSKISDSYKGNQEVFDIFVISGIVMRSPVMLDKMDELLPPYVREKAEDIYKRFQGKRSEKEYFKISCAISPNDKQALDNYCVDKGYKKSEIFHIVYTKLLFDESEEVASFLKSIRDRDVIKKKKQIAKLSTDEYVSFLDDTTKKKLLNEFTKNLDEQKFADYIVDSIHSLLKVEEKKEEEEIEALLNEKIRAKKDRANKAIERLIDDSSVFKGS